MKPVIHWAIRNSPAMNTLMVAVLAVGLSSMFLMRREVFPEFDLEVVLISVPYPGASPAEVEQGVCQKLEEAVRSIDGIKKQTAIAREGKGHLVLELGTRVRDVPKVLSDIRSEVDRIPSFPELAEDAEIRQLSLRQVALRVGVVGPQESFAEAELQLRNIAERVRHELLRLPDVSQAQILGGRDYQIDIEVPERTLRKYGLTLTRIAAILRRQNIEIPGGRMRTQAQEVLLRGKSKELDAEAISRIPLLTQPNGVVLTVGDLGTVKSEFTDDAVVNLINGRPGLTISIDRTADEDLLAIAAQVRRYTQTASLPHGYKLVIWQDTSLDVQDRIRLLSKNGLQGLLLVFLVLAAFLEMRLAFWVALGIPVAVLGSCSVLLAADQTINMVSLFAFLLALGIVVDDAIVIGENIYAHRQQGKDAVTAAVEGTAEVLPAVSASVTTTIIAFLPLFYVSGVMGKFIAVLPLAVVAMLVISLVESTLILPCHLAHQRVALCAAPRFPMRPWRRVGQIFGWLNARLDLFLGGLIERFYLPSLGWGIRNPFLVLSTAIALLLVTAAFEPAGITPWTVFPELDSNWIQAKVAFPDGTPSSYTDRATRQMEAALHRIAQRHSAAPQPLVQLVQRSVGEVVGPGALGPDSRNSGSHLGIVFVELCDASLRTLSSDDILDSWRKATGEIAGVDSLTFEVPEFGPGGAAIEFKLLAPAEHMAELESAVEQTKRELAHRGKYPGVVDIVDDSRPGKWEYQLKIKDRAQAMGVSAADLAETVRSAYYGQEVMRLQRGRHEVKLMVRYPAADRQSLADFEDVHVRDGWQATAAERPLTELADVKVERGYSEINRVDQLRSITITADVRESAGNASAVVAKLQQRFMPQLLARHPHVSVRWEGQQEQSADSLRSLMFGFIVAVLAMFALLTLVFRSYLQPLIVLLTIPFGTLGAVWGHAVLDLSLTMFSLFGIVALTGVVVNDAIVLIDFINRRIRSGDAVFEALTSAGARRFRPVLLTSLTTIAGLTPIMLETSFQAQVLIPMAASLCFGLMVATVLILYLVPVFYLLYFRLTGPRAVISPVSPEHDWRLAQPRKNSSSCSSSCSDAQCASQTKTAAGTVCDTQEDSLVSDLGSA